MDNKSIVRLHANVTINSKDWQTFKQKLAAVKIIIESEGANVLTHETYCQSCNYNCLIIEAYKDEKAFLNHLENVKPLSGKYQVDWKVNRMELSGAYDEETVNAMREASSSGEFVFYDNKL